MQHLGDITKISGHTAPIVDCIIGGSPCQDLSVAGKRAGLDGERSGLYMEQIRIVKEMRAEDERNGRTGVDIRPRYMVWENVPGAFSSNKGEDFRIVLEELAKVKDKDAVIPMPDKWTNCGCIMGDGWSIAWRVLDAQFWGVPQRRRRIALVADFGGESAPEILFVRKSLSGHSDESIPKRKATPSDATGGFGADDCYTYNIGDRYGVPTEHKDFSPTLTARCGTGGNNVPAVVQERVAGFCHEQSAKTRDIGYEEEMSPTLRVGAVPAIVRSAYTMQDREGKEGGGKGALIAKELSATLRANNAQYVFQPVKTFSKSKRAQSDTDFETWQESDTANTLNGFDTGDVRTCEAVVYVVDQGGGKSACDVREGTSPTLTTTHDGAPVACYQDKVGSLCARDYKGVGSQYVDEGKLIVEKHPSAVCYSFNPSSSRDAGDYVLENVANPLINGTCPGHKSAVAYIDTSRADDVVRVDDTVAPLQARDYKGGKLIITDAVAVDCRNGLEAEVNGALQSNMAHSLNGNNVVRTRYIVRRLTPLECERLQGYPDGWTDIGEYIDSNGKKRQTSDASRYKALGNSIALPPWKWVLKRLCACYERDATLGSLFDGIGGFPYLWEQLNGKGTCLWASEIEEFPMAVTKIRIGDD